MGFGVEIDPRTVEDMAEVRRVVDAYAPEETRRALADDFGTTPPLPRSGSVAFDRYQHRVMRALAEIIEARELAANTRPRRGRPPKSETEPTSRDVSMDRTAETEEESS